MNAKSKFSPDDIKNHTSFKPLTKQLHNKLGFVALQQYVKFMNKFAETSKERVRMKDFLTEDGTAAIINGFNHDDGTTIVMSVGVGDEGGNATLLVTYNAWEDPRNRTPPLKIIDTIIQHYDTMATIVYANGKLDPEGRSL